MSWHVTPSNSWKRVKLILLSDAPREHNWPIVKKSTTRKIFVIFSNQYGEFKNILRKNSFLRLNVQWPLAGELEVQEMWDPAHCQFYDRFSLAPKFQQNKIVNRHNRFGLTYQVTDCIWNLIFEFMRCK